MKLHSFALAALCTSLVVEASSIHDRVGGHSLNSRHARLSRRGDGGSKRCRNRTPPAQVDGGNNGQKQNYTGGNDNKQNDQQNHDQQNNNQGQQNNNQGQQNNNQDQQNNNGQGKDQQNNNNNNNSNNNNNNGGGVISGTTGGVISVSSTCGDIGACSDITGTCGPNGSLGWLNCGVDGSGWRPQHVTIGDLKVVDLNEALKDSNSPFHACSAFVDKFYQYGGEFGVPPIVIASFAMQESSCNPQTTGGGGEAGLMQITHDKCGDAPGGNCYDIDYNIRTGTRFFKNTVDNAGGNVLKAIGMYNGWQEGMTYGSATAARFSACCKCQNNLDYLHQMLNGWFQNISPYARHMGQYFNLDSC